MIQKGLAFRWQQSGSGARLDEAAWPRYGILPRRHHCQCGASAVTARKAVSTEEGFEMKLTDTQLVLLSAASQREDRAVELPANLKGGAAHKVVANAVNCPDHGHRWDNRPDLLSGRRGSMRARTLRNDRRHDPIQARLGRRLRGLCRLQQVRIPRRGRGATRPWPDRRYPRLFR